MSIKKLNMYPSLPSLLVSVMYICLFWGWSLTFKHFGYVPSAWSYLCMLFHWLLDHDPGVENVLQHVGQHTLPKSARSKRSCRCTPCNGPESGRGYVEDKDWVREEVRQMIFLTSPIIQLSRNGWTNHDLIFGLAKTTPPGEMVMWSLKIFKIILWTIYFTHMFKYISICNSVSDPSHFDVDLDPDPDPGIHIWEKWIRILGSTFP